MNNFILMFLLNLVCLIRSFSSQESHSTQLSIPSHVFGTDFNPLTYSHANSVPLWGQAVYPLWWPSLTKDMQTEQLLCWSGVTVTMLAQTKKKM